jgi:hypothetical protein
MYFWLTNIRTVLSPEDQHRDNSSCRDFIARHTFRLLHPVSKANTYNNLAKKYLAKINCRFNQSTSVSLVYYNVTFFLFQEFK